MLNKFEFRPGDRGIPRKTSVPGLIPQNLQLQEQITFASLDWCHK
jgi:hypothetical protein